MMKAETFEGLIMAKIKLVLRIVVGLLLAALSAGLLLLALPPYGIGSSR